MNGSGPVDRAARLVGERLSIVFLLAVAVSAWEVIARYVFAAPTIWGHDLATLLTATGFVLAGAYAMHRRAHIAITFLRDSAPAPVREALDLLCDVLTVVFFAALAWATVRFAIPSVRLMETSGRAWDVPIPALLKSILALGSCLMLAQSGERLLLRCIRLLRGERS